jgi:hypothetical protein
LVHDENLLYITNVTDGAFTPKYCTGECAAKHNQALKCHEKKAR